MKKYLLLLALSLQFSLLFGQVPADNIRSPAVTPSGGNFNKRAQVDANLKASLSLNIPRASAFTLNGAKDSVGYIMFNTTINRFGVYRGNGQWDVYAIASEVPIKADTTKAPVLVALGSSLTSGINLNNVRVDSTIWSYKSAKALGYSLINRGLSGRRMQEVTSTDSSIYSVRNTLPSYQYKNSLHLIESYVNDTRADTLTNTVTIYKARLNSTIDALISKGWPAANLMLFQPSYYNQATAPNHGYLPYRQNIYAAAMLEVATARGTRYLDLYSSMKALQNVTHDYVGADSLHMTLKGNQYAADQLVAYIKTFNSTVYPITTYNSKVTQSLYVNGNESVKGNLNVGATGFMRYLNVGEISYLNRINYVLNAETPLVLENGDMYRDYRDHLWFYNGGYERQIDQQTIRTNGSTGNGGQIAIQIPAGGFYLNTAASTGAIAINLPTLAYPVATYLVIKGTIKVNGVNDQDIDFTLSGYARANTATWLVTTARITGNLAASNYQVRFAKSNTNKIIYIGELATAWGANLSVSIDEVVANGPGATVGNLGSGWSIGIESTAFQTVDVTKTATFGGANLAQSTGITPIANGGTGLASYTAGNYLNAASSTTLQQRTPAQVRTDIGAIALTNLSATAPIVYNNTTGVISSQPASETQVGYVDNTNTQVFSPKAFGSAIPGQVGDPVYRTTISANSIFPSSGGAAISGNPSGLLYLYSSTANIISLLSGSTLHATFSPLKSSIFPTNLVIGNDDSGSGTVQSTTISGASSLAYSGATINKAGSDLTLRAGASTGNSTAGDVVFQTADATTSGNINQTYTTKMTLNKLGNLGLGGAPTAKISILNNALGTTGNLNSTGISLLNTTPATIALNQNSPSLVLGGHVWGDTEAADFDVRYSAAIEKRSNSQANSGLVFKRSSDGGSTWVEKLILTGTGAQITGDFSIQSGGLTVAGSVSTPTVFATSNLAVGASVLGSSTSLAIFKSNSKGIQKPNFTTAERNAIIGSGGSLVQSILPVTVGSGYTTATVSFTGGGSPTTTAAATAIITGGQVTGFNITSYGNGYSSIPTVVITGDGTGATATAYSTPLGLEGWNRETQRTNNSTSTGWKEVAYITDFVGFNNTWTGINTFNGATVLSGISTTLSNSNLDITGTSIGVNWNTAPNFAGTLRPTTQTQSNSWLLPNKTGTVALTSDIATPTTYAVGDLVVANSTTTLTNLPDVATTNVLLSGGVGVAPSYGKVALGSAVSGVLPINMGGMGTAASGLLGGMPYATSATVNGYIAPNTTSTRKFLRETGTGTVGAAPVWDVITAVDLPIFTTNYTASGTGAATTIVVPHGLTGITTAGKVIVQPLNAASAGVTYVTIDATNVNINYTVAPVNGTGNLSYTIEVRP